MLAKRVGHFNLPNATNPKWEVVMHHGLGQDVVYTVFDDNDRKEVSIRDVEVGDNFLRFKFQNKAASVKIVVVG
jgi:hypothetical protein